MTTLQLIEENLRTQKATLNLPIGTIGEAERTLLAQATHISSLSMFSSGIDDFSFLENFSTIWKVWGRQGRFLGVLGCSRQGKCDSCTLAYLASSLYMPTIFFYHFLAQHQAQPCSFLACCALRTYIGFVLK
jgi:hypothetical protein